MAELGQQMTRLEQQLAALSNGVDQMRQDAGRNASSTALAPQIEALCQASARQEKANVDILRDSKNFQATVREQMQSELERYHKMFADTAHAPILSAIANLYIVSERAISFLKDAKERRNVSK